MKFDRQLRPATETSWLVSYGGKTIPRWRTAAILKIDIGLSPYLGEKSSDFHEILYTAADFELDERHEIKKWKSCIGQTPSSTERISCLAELLVAQNNVLEMCPCTRTEALRLQHVSLSLQESDGVVFLISWGACRVETQKKTRPGTTCACLAVVFKQESCRYSK